MFIDKAERLIVDLIDQLEISNYYRKKDDPYFIGVMRWLIPELDKITDKYKLASVLGAIFTTAGATKEEITKMITNLYEFYDDSDLIPDWRDEDEY